MRESLKELGMPNSRNSGISIPSIRKMITTLPSGHPWIDVADILRLHTVIPLFLFFENDQTYKGSIENLVNKQSKNLNATLGMSIHLTGRNNLPRYCLSCVDESKSKNGYSIYTRNHQVSCVKVCDRHREVLRFGCRVCGYDSVGRQRRHMAGHCDCKEPTPFFSLAKEPSEEDMNSLAWITRQIDFIFDIKSNPVGKNLLSETLISSISTNRDYRNSKAFRVSGPFGIADRLNSRFTSSALELLGSSPYSSDGSVSPWVRNCIAFRSKDDKRSDPFKLILLSGLFYENLSDIPSIQEMKTIQPVIKNTTAIQMEKPTSTPKGYGSKTNHLADSLSKEDISATLERFNFNIDRSASSLGIGSSSLLSLSKHFRFRIPLQKHQLARIGLDRINSVRLEIKKGTPYISIIKKLSLSSYSLDLILLDDPDYIDIHRSATIENQKNSHRNAIIKFAKEHIGCTGDDIRFANEAAFDWIKNFDTKWWSDTVQPILDVYQSQKPFAKRIPRKNWDAIDLDLSARANSAAQQEYQKESIPIRLTSSRIVQEIGYKTNFSTDKAKLPKLCQTLQKLSEDRDTYYKRRLTWALNEVHRAKIPMSMNQFRRIAAMTAPNIMEYLPWINEQISILKLGIDAKSCFSLNQ